MTAHGHQWFEGYLGMQAMARDAGEESGNDGELAALADEADMPLDQLMALYGYVQGGDEPEEKAAQLEGQSSAEEKQPGKQSAAVEQPEASAPAAVPMDVDSDDGNAADPEAAEEKPGRDLADLMDKGTRYLTNALSVCLVLPGASAACQLQV